MQVLRLNEVLMRVVAWHNRHPLARRITAAQVHSIGEVLLPFAASTPALAPSLPAAVSSLPDVADLLQPPQAAVPMVGDDHGPAEPVWPDDTERAARDAVPDTAAPATTAPDAADLPPDRDAEAPPTPAAEPETDAEASPFTLAEADLAAGLAAELNDAAPAPAAAAAEALDLALPLEPQAAVTPPPAPPALAPALHTAPGATTPPTATAPPPSRLKRLLARLTGRQPGMPRLQSTFSRDFIWPLSPRRVACWARAHGQLLPLAPTDWPRRVVETDGRLLGAARQKGLAHSVELHVLTAAIGVGDRRLRVLMDAQGAVIGPRAYSRPRLAAAGSLVAMALLGVGWTTLRPKLPDGSAVLAAAAAASAPAASAPLGAASTAALAVQAEPAASAASAASSAVMAAAAASVPVDGASPTLHADAAPAASADTTLLAQQPADTHAAGLAPAGQPADAAPAATPATRPTAPAAAGQSGSLGRVRPSLSDEDKQAARAQTATLRGNKADAPRALAVATAPVTVYAVVTRPSPQREVASAGLAVMKRAGGRLPDPVPAHSELMQNQGAWRAAWWPFASLADAERARVLLAGKGLKVDVVEF